MSKQPTHTTKKGNYLHRKDNSMHTSRILNSRTLSSPVYLRIYMNDKILEAFAENRMFCLLEVAGALRKYAQNSQTCTP